MSISKNSCRRVATGAISAGVLAGALVTGAAGTAQAAPAGFSASPPATVQVTGAPLVLGGQPPAAGPGALATGGHAGPMPQWWGHHWWRHHHHFWHHWWWWW
ncbi:hypothetical protein EHH44_16480 [Mycolicibacter terrae]|uniref:Uncharacterized protein n=1 Tax=Mycolicibacter terrae TaxID=1788 RepID=A0ACD2EK33_9MYCO|nr:MULTISPECIES: hypothetical protein [Mycolicibacter]RRR42709.1 hypothetical protein EHH44_16480 [Mycolicibacter terrae]